MFPSCLFSYLASAVFSFFFDLYCESSYVFNLIAPNEEIVTMKNILVLIDFSDVTEDVIQKTSLLAESLKHSKVWLLHVALPHPDLKQYEKKVYTKAMRDEMAKIYHEEHIQLQNYSNRIRKKGIESTAILVQGDILEIVVDKVPELEVDVIVIGYHEHSALRDFIHGNVNKDVLNKMDCPLLLVRSKK